MRTITVLMTARNSYAFIRRAVRSILSQELPRDWTLSMLIAVDADERTLDVLHAIKDTRVRVFYNHENVGTYVLRNSLLPYVDGEIVQQFDSDDIMLPGTLAAVIEAFVDESVDICKLQYRAFHDEQEWRLSCLYEDGAAGTYAFRTSSWNERVGGFSPVRSGSDTESLLRAEANGMTITVLPAPAGMLYRLHAEQLTHDTERSYLKVLAKRAEEIAAGIGCARIADPCAVTLTEVFLLREQDEIHICLASIPSRREALHEVIRRLTPQIEGRGKIHVFLNGWDDVPEFLHEYNVDVKTSQEYGDRGDAGKFYWLGKLNGYFLACDDDLTYEKGYVDRLVDAIDAYDRRIIVTFHGEIMHHYDDVPEGALLGEYREKTLQCTKEVLYDEWVHIPGTGVTGFHTDVLPDVTWDCFPVRNMADVWLGVLCQRRCIPVLVLAHRDKLVTIIPGANPTSIWNSGWRRDGSWMDTSDVQIQIIKVTQPWCKWSRVCSDLELRSLWSRSPEKKELPTKRAKRLVSAIRPKKG